jgi:hypothetical protein
LDGLMLLQDKIARNERRPGVVKPRVDPVQEAEKLVQLRRSAADPRQLVAARKEEERRDGTSPALPVRGQGLLAGESR